MKNLVFLLLVVSAFVGISCKKNPHKVKLSGNEKDVEIVKFGDEFFAAGYSDTSAIVALRNKYPDFFDLFTYRVIQIGGLGEEQFFEGVKHFQTDTMILNIRKSEKSVFSDFSKIEKYYLVKFHLFQK